MTIFQTQRTFPLTVNDKWFPHGLLKFLLIGSYLNQRERERERRDRYKEEGERKKKKYTDMCKID